MSQTYLIMEPPGGIAHYIICGMCGRKSYNPDDITGKFCGRCQIYHEDPLPDIRLTGELNGIEKDFVALALQGLAIRMGPTGFGIAIVVAEKVGVTHLVQELLNDFLAFARKVADDKKEAS